MVTFEFVSLLFCVFVLFLIFCVFQYIPERIAFVDVALSGLFLNCLFVWFVSMSHICFSFCEHFVRKCLCSFRSHFYFSSLSVSVAVI